ncbi:MAG: ABC transporter substrate-binding protein [Candidatus Rokuibacteriota bacterium]
MDRREFLIDSALTGLLGPRRGWAAEPPPETTKLVLRRLLTPGAGCFAPLYVAEELLRGEGFTDVQYARKGTVDANKALATGEIHLTMGFVGNSLIQVDAGDPIVVLTGIHVGCFELFATDRVRTIRDLKGKTVSVTELGSGRHVFLAAAMAYVGLDPQKDVRFVNHPPAESAQLLAEGKIDAYQAFAEEVQELRAKKIGRSVLNNTLDRPWSQYFCCMAAANKEFVRKHPVATKRALRAMLKASSICALEPDRAARFVVDKGYAPGYDSTLQMLKELPYTRWRDLDPEDAIRFYAVRLHEAGMIKSTPQKLIAQGTDWRFLNELKKELKG